VVSSKITIITEEKKDLLKTIFLQDKINLSPNPKITPKTIEEMKTKDPKDQNHKL
jgi:hypothetical protein